MAIGCEREDWDAHWPSIAHYWHDDGQGNLVNDVQVEIYAECLTRYGARTEKASKAANARWNARSNAPSNAQASKMAPKSDAKPMLGECPLGSGSGSGSGIGDREPLSRPGQARTGSAHVAAPTPPEPEPKPEPAPPSPPPPRRPRPVRTDATATAAESAVAVEPEVSQPPSSNPLIARLQIGWRDRFGKGFEMPAAPVSRGGWGALAKSLADHMRAKAVAEPDGGPRYGQAITAFLDCQEPWVVDAHHGLHLFAGHFERWWGGRPSGAMGGKMSNGERFMAKAQAAHEERKRKEALNGTS